MKITLFVLIIGFIAFGCSKNVTRSKINNSELKIMRVGIMDTLTVSVSGKVFSLLSKSSISEADVKLTNKEYSFSRTTNKDGEFEFLHIPSGRYQITSKFIGHYRLTDSVEFKTGEIVDIEIKLWADR
jgi:hypothetical protein